MTKKRNGTFFFLMAFLLSAALCCPAPGSAFAAAAGGDYVALTAPASARVAEVIDADALLVQLPTGAFALVRLSGVNGQGYTPGFEALTRRLLGQNVYLVPDSSAQNPVGRWNYMHVYAGTTDISAFLTAQGYATVQPGAGGVLNYDELTENERIARNQKLGLWSDGDNVPVYAYTGDLVNINTASRTELSDYLDIRDGLAAAIFALRDKRPYQTVSDVKFADGMTKSIYDSIRQRITVVTDINTASKDELTMLIGLAADDAEAIIEYRDEEGFTSLSALYTEGVIRRTHYEANEPFITRDGTQTRITYAAPDYTANVNTATANQLREAGLTAAQARRVMDDRGKYPFKSMADVGAALGLSNAETLDLTDNLTVVTNLNEASLYELRTLFGGHADAAKTARVIEADRPFSSLTDARGTIVSDLYARIAAYVTVGDDSTDYVNLNLADAAQLKAAGFTDTQAGRIVALQPDLADARDLPYDMAALGLSGKVTLRTNVNRASAAELKALSRFMTSEAAEGIVRYRLDQPFGSAEELRVYLTSVGLAHVFGLIEDGVCVY